MILAQDLNSRFCFRLTTISQESSSVIGNNKNLVCDVMQRCQRRKDHQLTYTVHFLEVIKCFVLT